MTEAEWLVCDNPRELIRSVATWKWHGFYELGRAVGLLRQNVTERRYRLYACACMRQAWHLIGPPEGRAAVELAEQYVDGEASLGDLLAARSRIQEAADSTMIGRALHSLPAELPTRRPATAGIGVTQRDARLAAYSASSEVADLLVSEHLDDLRRPSAYYRMFSATSSAIPSVQQPLIWRGALQRPSPSLAGCTNRATFPRCRSWPTRSRTPGATATTY